MNKIIKFLKETDFDDMILDIDSPQNLRCKINTGYICNSNCSFCYFHSKRSSCNYPIEVIKRQLDIAKKNGVKSVDFSGGEPTIHKDFIPALEYASELGFDNICCITNGSTFDDKEYIERCKRAGLNDILFSLHGTEYLHDFITGVEGLFGKAVRGIINANLNGLSTRVNTVIIKNNYRNLNMLAKELNELNLVQWNMIIYKMQYECGDPEKDNFVSHVKSSSRIKQAIDTATRGVKIINVRYIPMCFMRGYEKHVTNYNQKKYDPYEWSNCLLKEFEMGDEHIMNMCDTIDMVKCNEEMIKYNRSKYTKPFKCSVCKDFLICDGFENGYSKRTDVRLEATKAMGNTIKNPLYYRGDYGT